MARRYGAPYLTMHRADLQAACCSRPPQRGRRAAAQGRPASPGRARPGASRAVQRRRRPRHGRRCAGGGRRRVEHRARTASAATGRRAHRPPGLPRAGRQSTCRRRSAQPRGHRVAGAAHAPGEYPVRGGEWLNVVCHGARRGRGRPALWDQAAMPPSWSPRRPVLRRAARSAGCHAGWRLWVLHDRAPVAGRRPGARAASPCSATPPTPCALPGARRRHGDRRRAELGRVLAAQARTRPWTCPPCCSAMRSTAGSAMRVCRRAALRNGQIFHADGVVRWGRDFAVCGVGRRRVLDMPWLYGTCVSA
jgi:salicylate hydroxylase